MLYVLDTTKFVPPDAIKNSSPPGHSEKYAGIIRYAGTPHLAWKNIDPDEQARYNDAGVSVAYVHQIGTSGALSGRDEGKRNATSMLSDLTRCRANAIAGHFVAQDTDYTGIDWKPRVAAYFEGVHSVCDLHLFTVSGYGSYQVIKFLFDEGLIQIGWQTKAWSRDKHGQQQREMRASIYQQLGYVYPGNIQCDWNMVFSGNWGQNDYEGIGANFMLSAEQEARLNRAVDLILSTAGPGQRDLAGTLEATLATTQGLVNLVRAGNSTLATAIATASNAEQAAVLAAIAAIPTDHLTQDELNTLVSRITDAISDQGITIDSDAILDALKTRLEA